MKHMRDSLSYELEDFGVEHEHTQRKTLNDNHLRITETCGQQTNHHDRCTLLSCMCPYCWKNAVDLIPPRRSSSPLDFYQVVSKLLIRFEIRFFFFHQDPWIFSRKKPPQKQTKRKSSPLSRSMPRLNGFFLVPWKSVQCFLHNPADNHTYKQEDRGENRRWVGCTVGIVPYSVNHCDVGKIVFFCDS